MSKEERKERILSSLTRGRKIYAFTRADYIDCELYLMDNNYYLLQENTVMVSIDGIHDIELQEVTFTDLIVMIKEYVAIYRKYELEAFLEKKSEVISIFGNIFEEETEGQTTLTPIQESLLAAYRQKHGFKSKSSALSALLESRVQS